MKEFLTDIKENQKQFWKVFLLVCCAVGIGTSVPYFLMNAGGQFPELNAYLDHLNIKFDILICLQPIVMLMVACIAICFEILGIGYANSTLKRLLTTHSKSLLTDLFYFILRISGIIPLIVLVVSIGNFYTIKTYMENFFAFKLLFSLHPVFHILPVVLVHSFAFYIYHRLMHTKYFWEIHKVHHSAEDFNILLPYRNHPIDFLFAQIIIPSFVAMLGAHQAVVFGYLLVNSIYQSMVHSNFYWNKPWLDTIFITPEAHKIHHADDPKYFDKNFGILSFWDKIFGTYYYPSEKIEKIGVKEKEDFNTGHPFVEMIVVFLKWIKLKK